MLYQDPRVTFKSLALRQWQALSPNWKNLVAQVLKELLQMQADNEDHPSNDNPFMKGCSLFETHSKSLTKWGIKITYGISQDKIDIVCIEVDPSPLPPSGPQAISIRSFSANDNYEFVQHPVVEVHIAFSDLKKVGAWLASGERSSVMDLTDQLFVNNFSMATASKDWLGSEFDAASPCKEKYQIKTHLELNPVGLNRCASRILLTAHSFDVISDLKLFGAIAMSSILGGLNVRVYEESIRQFGSILRSIDGSALGDPEHSNGTGRWDAAFKDFFVVELPSVMETSPSIIHEQISQYDDTFEGDRWCTSTLDLSVLALLGTKSTIAGQPPCYLN